MYEGKTQTYTHAHAHAHIQCDWHVTMDFKNVSNRFLGLLLLLCSVVFFSMFAFTSQLLLLFFFCRVYVFLSLFCNTHAYRHKHTHTINRCSFRLLALYCTSSIYAVSPTSLPLHFRSHWILSCVRCIELRRIRFAIYWNFIFRFFEIEMPSACKERKKERKRLSTSILWWERRRTTGGSRWKKVQHYHTFLCISNYFNWLCHLCWYTLENILDVFCI